MFSILLKYILLYICQYQLTLQCTQNFIIETLTEIEIISLTIIIYSYLYRGN
jgi:hypothetical protein